MENPSVLEGLKECLEYLKTMPEEECVRIAEDYRAFCKEYDQENSEHNDFAATCTYSPTGSLKWPLSGTFLGLPTQEMSVKLFEGQLKMMCPSEEKERGVPLDSAKGTCIDGGSSNVEILAA